MTRKDVSKAINSIGDLKDEKVPIKDLGQNILVRYKSFSKGPGVGKLPHTSGTERGPLWHSQEFRVSR